MLDAMTIVGNPSSVHAAGRAARAVVEAAREALADLLQVNVGQVTFTSGATEANNLALNGLRQADGIIPVQMAASTEHESVRQALREGAVSLPVDTTGLIDLVRFEEVVATHTPGALISVMLANNETGVIQPIPHLSAIARARGHFFHCDATQAIGRMPVHMAALGADLLSLSAHKLGGPKGIGALIARKGVNLHPFMKGGGQERGLRPGTENVLAIAGFGAVARTLRAEESAGFPEIYRLRQLRDQMERSLKELASDIVIAGDAVPRLFNTTCAALPGLASQLQLMALDLDGIAVSAGSACSSGKVKPSHVLRAMGFPEILSASALRISLGYGNDASDVTRFMESYKRLIARRQAA